MNFTKNQIAEQLLRAEIEGFKPSNPPDLSNFILDSDNLTTGESYEGTTIDSYNLQKWVDDNGEKHCSLKTAVVLTDDSGQSITKRIFGRYEVGNRITAKIVEATAKDGKVLLSKRTGKPFRNFSVSSVIETESATANQQKKKGETV